MCTTGLEGLGYDDVSKKVGSRIWPQEPCWGTATQRMEADSLEEQTWTDWRSSTRVEELSNELRSAYRHRLNQVKDCGGVWKTERFQVNGGENHRNVQVQKSVVSG